MAEWKIKAFYDGLCPVCSREMRWMRAKAARRGAAIAFEDLTSDDFDPADYGLSHEQVMARMHAVLPDGRVISGVEVFRHIYRELGMGWMLAWTKLPVLRQLADAAYWCFAKVRPRLSAHKRCTAETCATASTD